MKVSLGETGVPMVVTYRKILRKPKITRERRYVGAFQALKNLLARAIEMVEEAAFETKTEVVDPGQSVSVHWAISVEDPWDTTTGVEKNLVAYRMLNDIPPSGVHFEVISPPREEQARSEVKEDPAELRPSPPELTPEQFKLLRHKQEQQSILQGTRSPNGGFRQPPAPEYGPRRVKTIEEELAEGAGINEDVEDVGGSGLFGEDD